MEEHVKFTTADGVSDYFKVDSDLELITRACFYEYAEFQATSIKTRTYKRILEVHPGSGSKIKRYVEVV